MKIYGISIFIVIAAFLFSLSSAEDVDNRLEAIRCSSDNDCPYQETCYYNQCVDVCLFHNGAMVDIKCGNNSICHITSEHTAFCGCYSGYVDNPDGECIHDPKTVRSCTNNDNCATYEVCHKKKCVDICQYHDGNIVENKCAKHAHCLKTDNHKAICKCYSSYHGDPYSYCEKDDRHRSPCRFNDDCSMDSACYRNECIGVCKIKDGNLVKYKCGRNAYCDVSQPHVGTCTCASKYIGDPYTQCNKIVGEGETCENDNDCLYYEACLNKKCDYICQIHDGKIVDHKCGINAYCYNIRPHVANCKCHNGYRGDPFSSCFKDS